MLKYTFRLMERIHAVSPGLKQALNEQFSIEQLQQDHYLLKPGQTCDRVWLVLSGLLRGFTRHGNKEYITWFRKANEIAVPLSGFFQKKRSDEFIVAIEPTVVACLTFQQRQELRLMFPEFAIIDTHLVEQHYTAHAFHSNIYKLSAKERYKYFLDTHPELVARLPQKYIASYLRMREETLSRLRGRKY